MDEDEWEDISDRVQPHSVYATEREAQEFGGSPPKSKCGLRWSVKEQRWLEEERVKR